MGTSDRCEQTSERTRKWSSTYVSIHGCCEPPCNFGPKKREEPGPTCNGLLAKLFGERGDGKEESNEKINKIESVLQALVLVGGGKKCQERMCDIQMNGMLTAKCRWRNATAT